MAAHYIYAESTKQIKGGVFIKMSNFHFAYENKPESKHCDIFAPSNKYEYHISINHPKINERWQRFCIEWETENNIKRIDENTWEITTAEGTYTTSRPWDYTERRKQFELFIISDPALREDFEKEIEKYGESFECAKGIKLEKLYKYWGKLEDNQND